MNKNKQNIQSFASGIFLILGIIIVIVGIYFTTEMVNRQIKLNQQKAIIIDELQYDIYKHKDKSEEQQLSFELIGRLSIICIGLWTTLTSLEYSNIFKNSTE